MPSQQVSTYAEVAAKLGLKEKTMRLWHAKGCRALDAPPYDVQKIADWRARKKADPEVTETDSDHTSPAERKVLAEIEYTRVRTRLGEYKELELQRKLIPVEDVERANAQVASAIASALKEVPQSQADHFVGLDSIALAQVKLQKVIDGVLKILHNKREIEGTIQ